MLHFYNASTCSVNIRSNLQNKARFLLYCTSIISRLSDSFGKIIVFKCCTTIWPMQWTAYCSTYRRLTDCVMDTVKSQLAQPRHALLAHPSPTIAVVSSLGYS